ncbi:hypothetical protein VCV18_005352 [Metarhizium anisopliae]
MPNTGRPSQDCHLCRQRRVKIASNAAPSINTTLTAYNTAADPLSQCDLGRPGCQRCVKYGVECPGYRDQHDLVFRNANPSTVKKRRKRAAAKEGGQDDSKSPSPAGTRSSTPASLVSNGEATFTFDSKTELLPLPGDTVSTALTSISRPLTEHWTNHSVPIILNVYSTLDFLHNIYRINPRNGPLVWAAHLFTRTYVTNIRYPVSVYKESEVENQRELGTYLGKTLSAVNTALKEPDGAFRDDVLATVWILANYEVGGQRLLTMDEDIVLTTDAAAGWLTRSHGATEPLASTYKRALQYTQDERYRTTFNGGGEDCVLAVL